MLPKLNPITPPNTPIVQFQQSVNGSNIGQIPQLLIKHTIIEKSTEMELTKCHDVSSGPSESKSAQREESTQTKEIKPKEALET